MDVILNIQKKLNFYALQLFYFSSSLGENLSESRASEHLLFGQKTKKSKSKEKNYCFFCLLSTSLAFFFCFKWRKRILCFFLQTTRPLGSFWRLNRGQFFL